MSAMVALTRFDQLLGAFANHDGGLSDRQKRMLDDSLELHAEACSKLNLCPTKDNAARVVNSLASTVSPGKA